MQQRAPPWFLGQEEVRYWSFFTITLTTSDHTPTDYKNKETSNYHSKFITVCVVSFFNEMNIK